MRTTETSGGCVVQSMHQTNQGVVQNTCLLHAKEIPQTHHIWNQHSSTRPHKKGIKSSTENSNKQMSISPHPPLSLSLKNGVNNWKNKEQGVQQGVKKFVTFNHFPRYIGHSTFGWVVGYYSHKCEIWGLRNL